jgi:hypothetical protein
MKKLFAAVVLGGLGLLASPGAQAQSQAPDFPAAKNPGSSEGGARRNSRATSEELLRNQRQASMTPEEIKRDQQLAILEARTGMATGNTSFGRSGPERQFESVRGGFKVRKFKDKMGSGKQKRGQSHMASGVDPKGKPLVHNHGRKRFLIF